jgi:hypothetical protein
MILDNDNELKEVDHSRKSCGLKKIKENVILKKKIAR